MKKNRTHFYVAVYAIDSEGRRIETNDDQFLFSAEVGNPKGLVSALTLLGEAFQEGSQIAFEECARQEGWKIVREK